MQFYQGYLKMKIQIFKDYVNTFINKTLTNQ